MSAIRITLTLAEEQGKFVQDLAAKEKRTTASMAAILLGQAIKDRERNRKKGKDE